MDKNTYETYEYLPCNSDNGTDQFLVVQDDGTYFNLNRQVQYVAQVEGVKEVFDDNQLCTVYDVTPQQFFIGVDNAEMIPVSDNYILPTAEETNNLYSNSYLLQSVEPATSDQIEDEDQFKGEMQEEIMKKQNTSCTEITLTDDQYKTLEDKGWVLLEINNKVFLLDGLGLHDITGNQELIEHYKVETECIPGHLEDLGEDKCPKIKLGNTVSENVLKQEDNVELEVVHKSLHKEEIEAEIPQCDEQDEEKGQLHIDESVEQKNDDALKPKTHQANILRIKTKYCFKDIPDKIVLGKTVNGKNLVAKIIKRNPSGTAYSSILPEKPEKSPMATMETEDKGQKPSSISHFDSQMEQTLSGGINCSSQEFVAANEIISQLLKIPAFRPSIVGRNIILTKTKSNKVDESKEKSAVSTTVVSGTVKRNEDGEWRFVHVPNLWQLLSSELENFIGKRIRSIENSSSSKASDDNSDFELNIEAKNKLSKLSSELAQARSNSKTMDNFSVLHIHVAEKKENGVDSMSVTLKRQMPYKSQVAQKKRQQFQQKLFACSSCAAIFKSDTELIIHQETHCLDKDALMIDTDSMQSDFNTLDDKEIRKSCFIVKTDKGTQYGCLICSMKFNKLSNCQRHIKTHQSSKSLSENTDGVCKQIKYTCRLCPCSYKHSSTLAKHFSTVHIKSKVLPLTQTTET